MNFMELLNKLENYTCDESLQNVDVTANKIKGISFLIMKDHEGKVIDCIKLKDHRFDEPTVSAADSGRRVCLK